jgi:FG-GAP-like repeat
MWPFPKKQQPAWAGQRFIRPCWRRQLRLLVEELEPRNSPAGLVTANINLTNDPGVQQQPSVAVDPHDSQHIVVAFMDHSLKTNGYAGIGTLSSTDGGAHWSAEQALPLPTGFDQGAANPIVQFDGQGHIFITFMSVTYKGIYEDPMSLPNFEDRGIGETANNGIFVDRSDDGGFAWNSPVPVAEHIYDGKHLVPFDSIPDMAVDTFPTLPSGMPNPDYGDVYVTWTRSYPQYPPFGTDIYIAVSKDHGQSFQPQLENAPGFSIPVTVIQDYSQNDKYLSDPGGPVPTQVHLDGSGLVDQSNVTVGPGGDVYVSYIAGGDFTVVHSSDAGAKFDLADYNDIPGTKTAERVAFLNNDGLSVPETGLGSGSSFRLFPDRDILADPARPGYVYAVTADVIVDAQGNTLDYGDVLFSRSTDYGVHWSPTSRPDSTLDATILNDDNGGQSASGASTDVTSAQADPRMSIDAKGDLSIIWYDTRHDPAGHDLDVYGTTSTDGGKTFSPNFRVTQKSFDANKGVFQNPTTQPDGPEVFDSAGDVSGANNYNIGEYLGLALKNNTAYAAWTDTLPGNQDIYFSSYSLSPAPASTNDRYEPNENASAATNLGTVVQRLVPKLALPIGDEDWFTFQAAASGPLRVSAISADSSTLDPNALQLQLYDDQGNLLSPTQTDLENSSGGFIGRLLVYPSEANQTFYVRAFRASATNTSSTNYELDLLSLSEDLGMQPVGDVSNSISAGGEAVYRFTAPATGSLQVQFTNEADVNGNLSLQIMDANTNASLLPAPPQPTLLQSAEPNDSIGEANLTGLAGVGSVQIKGIVGDGPFGATSGDYDFYRLDAYADQEITFNLADPSGSLLDGVITLYDSVGNILHLHDYNSQGVGEHFSYLTNQGGTFYVAINAFGDNYLGFNTPPYQNGKEDPEVDPFIPGTGHGKGNNGAYVLTITTASAGAQSTHLLNVPIQQGQTILLFSTGDNLFVPGDTNLSSTGDFDLQFTNLDQFVTPNSPSILFPAGAGPSTEAVGDVNGDGYPDVVVADAQSNTVSVLLNNGNGTFQAPRQYTIGIFNANPTGSTFHLADFRRQVVLDDLNHDGKLDIVVTNFDSEDVSVLLGNGDGTFQPQRRFDATANPFSVAVGDVNGDGIPDIVAIDSQGGADSTVAVLLGKGDGSFKPETTFPAEIGGGFPFTGLYLKDLNGDGKADLIVVGSNLPSLNVFLGNGDGTFKKPVTYQPAGRLLPGMAVQDVNGDGIPDIVNAGDTGLGLLLGNGSGGKGDGTFTPFFDSQTADHLFPDGQIPVAVAVADLATGAVTLNSDGSVASTTTTLGKPDGHPDIIIAATGVVAAITNVGDTSPGIFVLPTLWDAQGHFKGLGAPIKLAPADVPLDVKVVDVNKDGVPDIVFVDANGLHVIYGNNLTVPPNNAPQTARNLGTVVHVEEQALTIVPGHEDAYYTLTVPTEAVTTADEVLDFSGFFQAEGGAGLNMQVIDSSGKILASGERFLITAHQGEQLTVHVFGDSAADGTRGYGAYTLDIDTLPQIVDVQAQALLPGAGALPGGPTASLVITLQGDRLDPVAAQKPANYSIIGSGPDGIFGTKDDISETPVSVVYDPSTNVDIDSGTTYATAIRQTITLLFDQPLEAGTYRIRFSPLIQTTAFNTDESATLTGAAFLGDHDLVSVHGSSILFGAQITAAVEAPGSLGDFTVWQSGTPFLSQLHDDLGALLDFELTNGVSDADIVKMIDQQIADRVAPALAGQKSVGVLVIWVDPRTFSLSDFQNALSFSNFSGSATGSGLDQTFAYALGNIDVIATPLFRETSFQLLLAAGSSTLRAGYVVVDGRGAPAQVPITSTNQSVRTLVSIDAGLNLARLLGPVPTPNPAPPPTPAAGPGQGDSSTIVPPSTTANTAASIPATDTAAANAHFAALLNQDAPSTPATSAPNGTIGSGARNPPSLTPEQQLWQFVDLIATAPFGETNVQLILALGSSTLRAGYVFVDGSNSPRQMPITSRSSNTRTVVPMGTPSGANASPVAPFSQEPQPASVPATPTSAIRGGVTNPSSPTIAQFFVQLFQNLINWFSGLFKGLSGK